MSNSDNFSINPKKTCLDNRLMGVAADDNPTTGKNISSMRGSMNGGHRKSTAAPDNPHPQLHFTGASTEYAKYLFNNKVLDDGDVISYKHNGTQKRAIFQRRDRRGSPNVIQTSIFYIRRETQRGKRVIDAITIDPHTKHDHVFGSELHQTETLKNILSGKVNSLSKDDDLTLPSSWVEGEFCDSLNLTTATLSDPDTIEDAYVFSETAADLFGGWGYFITNTYLRPDECLLDTYGRVENGVYVPRYYPAVGEAIRDDGLVIAKRRHDPLFGGILMSGGALKTADPHHDECVFVDADPKYVKNRDDSRGSRVVDVRVIRNDVDAKGNGIRSTSDNIRYLDEFAMACKQYYREIVEMYFSVNPTEFIWAPEAYHLVEAALASELHEVAPHREDEIEREIRNLMRERGSVSAKHNTMKTATKNPHLKREGAIIETYSIRITVKYPLPVTVSSKVTDNGGAKGIIGKVVPDKDMYRDERGQIIHVVRSSNAVGRRSTYSSIYHIFWDAASRDVREKVNALVLDGKLAEGWALLMDYLAHYNVTWSTTLDAVHTTDESKIKLIEEMNNIGVRIFLPHDLQYSPIEMTETIREKFPPYKSRLEFTNDRGEREWTKERIYVGTLPTYRLDKVGREFKSTSSMRTNFLGVISSGGGPGVNKPNSYPVKDEAICYGGESERRLFKNYSGMLFDHLYDINNNPKSHELLVRGLFTAETPSNPGILINRKEHPLGKNIPIMLMDSLHACEGFRMVKPVREDK